jgi:hypothetical protein
MTTISKGLYPAVTVTKTQTGKSVADVQLKVSDALVREQLHGFDGMERAFAMLPSERNGKLSWKKVSLDFAGSGIVGYYNRTFCDNHDKQLASVDAKAIAKYGVAFGMETNEGVVWAQDSGKNTKATIR